MSRSSRQNPRLIQNLLKPIAPHSDNRFRNNFAPAFTLTEVLLAVAIVGVIAALVLPMITNNIQTKALEQLTKRQTQTIENSVKGLLVNESVDSYLKTSLYSENETPTTFDDTTGKFMKKYLQVARYCGNSNGDCFAPKYYIYQNGDKEEYTPEYKGACATLKNGTSLCMYPRTNTDTDLKIVMDLNGKKGPNVKDRDLIEYSITLPNRGQLNPSTQAVSWTHHVEEITPPCADGTPTESCCADPSTFTTNCCTAFPEIYGSRSECISPPPPNTCSGSNAPITCCDSEGADYRRNNAAQCCTGARFNTYKTECCSAMPSDSRCTTPEAPDFCNPTPDVPTSVRLAMRRATFGAVESTAQTYSRSKNSAKGYYENPGQLKYRNLKRRYRFTMSVQAPTGGWDSRYGYMYAGGSCFSTPISYTRQIEFGPSRSTNPDKYEGSQPFTIYTMCPSLAFTTLDCKIERKERDGSWKLIRTMTGENCYRMGTQLEDQCSEGSDWFDY